MERITAEEAGKRLFEILERDAHGKRLIITHDGKDKAEIRARRRSRDS